MLSGGVPFLVSGSPFESFLQIDGNLGCGERGVLHSLFLKTIP